LPALGTRTRPIGGLTNIARRSHCEITRKLIQAICDTAVVSILEVILTFEDVPFDAEEVV
jgi:hypothetical protein